MDEKWIKLIVSILYAAAVVVPLVYELIKYVKKAVKEKNWNLVITKVLELMAIAEEKFTTGADRKEWVIAMLKASAESINYDIDYNVISEMIDNICAMSKVVNAGSNKAGV